MSLDFVMLQFYAICPQIGTGYSSQELGSINVSNDAEAITMVKVRFSSPGLEF